MGRKEDDPEYDPREDPEVSIVMETVSHRAEFFGLDVIRSVMVIVVCVFLLAPAIYSIYLLPFLLFLDMLICLSALILAVVTPPQVSSGRYIKRRRKERNGDITTFRSATYTVSSPEEEEGEEEAKEAVEAEEPNGAVEAIRSVREEDMAGVRDVPVTAAAKGTQAGADANVRGD